MKASDVMERAVTDLVAMEQGAGTWSMPWREMARRRGVPTNPVTGNGDTTGAL